MGELMETVLTDGTVLIDGTAAVTQREVRTFQQQLAEWEHRGARTVHVAGELNTTHDSWLDDHDAVGRLAVRFNVHRIVTVGEGARHIHNAAGLEGSWDGESLLVSDVQRAYDEVRPLRGAGTAILVTGSSVTAMSDIVALLKGDSA